MKDLALAQKAFDNRTHPNLYKVFCAIFGTSHLYTYIDHWGIMRGTQALELKTSKKKKEPRRKEGKKEEESKNLPEEL